MTNEPNRIISMAVSKSPPTHNHIGTERNERRVVRLENFTDEEMALIARVDAPAEYAFLDAELKDWTP
jgi:hypothetical protein